MSDTANPLEAAVAALTKTVEQIGGELGSLRQAFTDAEDERHTAEPDIETQARNAGLTVKQYQQALEAGRRAKFREDHGDLIREIVQEIVAPPAPSPEDGGSDDTGGASGGGGEGADDTQPPPAPPKAKGDPPADDSPPVGKRHWSDRSITEVLGLK